MKRVIARLGNGLGNQLFIYASAYSFAKKNNAELYVDDESGFYKRYKYELYNFQITAKVIDKKYKFLNFSGKIKRKLLKKINFLKKNKTFLVEQKDTKKLSCYNPNQFNITFTNNLYFEGYFQTEKYYLDQTKSVLKEFSFKNHIINQKNSFVDEIKKSNSVSLHLRNNKFLINENHKNYDKLNSEHLKFNIQTIKRGVEFFDKHIKNPKYFLWSNNFTGLRESFPKNKFIFVDENLNYDSAYDLYLMSLCKNFVLSPSTMHYWGAFLSKNTNKKCLAPPKMINASGYYGFSNNKDIKPSWWIEI